MSHIRSSLTRHDALYQSVGTPALPPSGEASAAPPRSMSVAGVTSPARGASWHDALRTMLALLRTWQARRRARRELAAVDARTLRDIGIDPGLVAYEIRQPLWRPLRDWRE